MCTNGRHRGRYNIAHPRGNQHEVLGFLQDNANKSYTVTRLSRILHLEKWRVRRAIDLLTYSDHRLCEDDNGSVMYLVRKTNRA